ncbi:MULTISPECIES: DNA alkylation repair protein [Clostridia]|uniref:DNA alkylation repair protein n=1 Tax=Clostridia TaxID=186801 RepID=UPI000EA2E830|nr:MULTISPECIES: DNA alkylation repair protein [Clostridia]NBJ71427.1 DNA alkylation repair protein [Roseburia sp. 1XD42-34]RKI74567.1 DNA alkylation repair protein [Clostridium sp. 1xD42-85]
MQTPYCCPNCKTNKTRFNRIDQVAHPIKLNAQTGEIVESYEANQVEAFHMKYQGPDYKIQCAACGVIEDEKTFIHFAQYQS